MRPEEPSARPQPRLLERNDVTEAVRYVTAHVKAPAIGALLQLAGCADPSPEQGKKLRVRAALNATQERDGHAGAVVSLIELVASAQEAERRRAGALRAAYTASGITITRATVKARDGFRFELGVSRDPGDLCLAITVLPDLEGTPILLDVEQAREFYRELAQVGKEVVERQQRPWLPPGRR